jgi:aspartyl-tRNA(Asn)/glutamyl-tRNA(Gln) amidotransferase subunit C
MIVDKETIRKIAHLSRLYFNEADEASMTDSLNEIIEWVNKLNEIDTTAVAPLTHMTQEVNAVRPDVQEPHLSHERALVNAPRRDSDYFRVPKVIE